jgi:hypothetical protein
MMHYDRAQTEMTLGRGLQLIHSEYMPRFQRKYRLKSYKLANLHRSTGIVREAFEVQH